MSNQNAIGQHITIRPSGVGELTQHLVTFPMQRNAKAEVVAHVFPPMSNPPAHRPYIPTLFSNEMRIIAIGSAPYAAMVLAPKSILS